MRSFDNYGIARKLIQYSMAESMRAERKINKFKMRHCIELIEEK
jgi:hypothetical protein